MSLLTGTPGPGYKVCVQLVRVELDECGKVMENSVCVLDSTSTQTDMSGKWTLSVPPTTHQMLTPVQQSFESPPIPIFSYFNVSTAARSSLFAFSGSFSLELQPVTATTMRAIYLPVPATPGDTYTGSAMFRPSFANENVRTTLIFRDKMGALLSSFPSPSTPEIAGQFVKSGVTAQAPATTATAELELAVLATTVSKHYVDLASLTNDNVSAFGCGLIYRIIETSKCGESNMTSYVTVSARGII